MRKSWTLVGISVLMVALAVAAIACSSSKKNTSATQTAAYHTPKATQGSATPKATAATPKATLSAQTPQATTQLTATPNPGGSVPTVRASDNPTLGKILVDGEGRTLYKFDNDQPNLSNCAGSCAQLWPPLTISGGTPSADTGVTGALGTIQRSDGTTQVTLDGTPLYRFSNDTAPGDTKGDGFAGHWSVIHVSG